MGRVIDRTQRMRHGMGNAQADVGICHGGYILGQCHPFTPVRVILHGLAQIFRDQLDCFQIQAVGQRPRGFRRIAFNRMGQGIHTSRGSQPFGHGRHHIRVHNCDVRNVIRVHADKLAFLLHVRNYIIDGGFRTGSARSRHGNGIHRAVLSRRHTLEGADIIIFGIVHNDADAFAGIH